MSQSPTCNYRRIDVSVDPYSYFRDIKLLKIIVDGYIREMQHILSEYHRYLTIPADINKVCVPYILARHSYFTIYDETHAFLQTIYEKDKDEQIIATDMSNIETFESANDYCYVCLKGGELLCCQSCPKVSHLSCAGLVKVPNDDWFCGYCMVKKPNPFKQCQLLQGKNTDDFTTDIVFISEIEINSGVHELMFQCIKSHPNDKIGIISEIDLNKLKTKDLDKVYLYNDAFGQHRYFWWLHTCNVRTHNKRIRLEGIAKWNVGSFIKMIIDCENWSLKFYHNQRCSQVISIDKNVTYYAVLAMGDSRSMYRYNIA